MIQRTRRDCSSLLLLLAVVGAAVLAGCGGQNGGSEQQAGTTVTTTGGNPGTTVTTTSGGKVVTKVASGQALRIPVIPKGTTHEYWKAIHAGALKAQQELTSGGRKIEIIWKGPELENDRSSQIDLVRNFVTQKVNGMVLAPLDDQALVQPVEQAVSARIPVVIIDSGLKTDKYTSFVSTDNEKGGALAGQRLGQLLNGKGNVLLLRYQVCSASTDLRETGFLSAIKKFPGIKLLSTNQYAGPTVDSGYQASQNLLNLFGSRTNGIFTPNESSTRGMLKALQQANLISKVKFVGFDASPDLVTALGQKQIQGLVVQNPFNMGYLGVKTLVDS
ncbi:MAG: substrate-binding domain-containing protein, partial [Chloroflexi bacterium]|nr:substrate-binding domain-containing protein [Chloroflexota bacterium]